MNFGDAILHPHDLTDDRLAAFCQYVGLTAANGTIKGPLPLSDIVRIERSKNHLKPLDNLRCRMGVYALQTDGCVIYIGKCEETTETWNLRERVSQHLRERDKGGTLRINWYRRHGCDFAAYKAMLTQCRLWTISFPQEGDTQKIARLEHLLIGLIGPKYCNLRAP